MDTIKKHSGGIYSLNYHFVWCPKRRARVLIGQIESDIRIILAEICASVKAEIFALEILPDHVHLFLSAPPKISPHLLIKRLKGKTSKLLRDKFKELQKLPSLWSSSYFVGSVGSVSESIVKMYIENQKGK